MDLDEESCYRAVKSRDTRFDGWFFVGVTTTGIFCRPSCPATTPRRANVRFYRSAASAQGEGFRACRRCRPDTAPGSPEWNVRGDLVGRAMTLIDDGLVDRAGVGAVAARLAVSERHLHRILVQELGAAPLALARSRRAQTARLLIETTNLPFTEIAFASGFSSIRQFNDTVRRYFGANPTTLRTDRPVSPHRVRSTNGGVDPTSASPGATPVSIRLAARAPFDGASILAFLGARAVLGVEAVGIDGSYHRVLRLPRGLATVALSAGADHISARLVLADLRDLGPAVARCRRLLDLDADPTAIDALLGADPVLEPLVAAHPGRRSPGTVDGAELLVRAVVGQQVSVSGARTVAGRIAADLGLPLPPGLADARADGPQLERAFPTPEAVADADPSGFSMPTARGRALTTASRAVADGRIVLDPGADRAGVEHDLCAVAGIGPWTASYVAMRALGDPDVFLPTDLGVLRSLTRLGGPSTPRDASQVAEAWRPWRSYALHHLWAAE